MRQICPGMLCDFKFIHRDIGHEYIVMQARNHAFLEGFMPSFAKAQMVLIHLIHIIVNPIAKTLYRTQRCRHPVQGTC